jgi:hypothetical protein
MRKSQQSESYVPGGVGLITQTLRAFGPIDDVEHLRARGRRPPDEGRFTHRRKSSGGAYAPKRSLIFPEGHPMATILRK